MNENDLWPLDDRAVINTDVDRGWDDPCECRCVRSATLVRISTNIKVGCLLLFHSPVSFPMLPHSLSLPSCSCIAINRRATVPYFCAQTEGERGNRDAGKDNCLERKGVNGVDERRRSTQRKGPCVCRSGPCDAIKAGICLCDHRFSSWYNKHRQLLHG